MKKKLHNVETRYPELFIMLKGALPATFFDSPETADVSVKRKYNDILSQYLFCEVGDMFSFKELQLIL